MRVQAPTRAAWLPLWVWGTDPGKSFPQACPPQASPGAPALKGALMEGGVGGYSRWRCGASVSSRHASPPPSLFIWSVSDTTEWLPLFDERETEAGVRHVVSARKRVLG